MPITRTSFNGAPFQAEVVSRISNMLVAGAPFASRLTPFPTSRGSVAWPVVGPVGQTWIPELGAFPAITLNDAAYVAVPAKLGGILTLSNESIDDSVFNIEAALGMALRDTLSADLDTGLLVGAGPPAPVGIVAVATAAAAGTDLRSASIVAWGELVAAGANPATIVAFVNPVNAATEMARVATGGVPIHADGDVMRVGMVEIVPVPKIAAGTILIADVSAVFLVSRNDFEVALDSSYAFANDGVGLRIKGRFAVAAPTPGRSLRKATITP